MFPWKYCSYNVLCLIVALSFLVSESTAVSSIHLDASKDATWQDCVVSQTHPGYSGNGYLDFLQQSAWVEWSVLIEQAGDYEIMARYTTRNPRPVELLIDGQGKGTFSFSGTAFPNWDTETLSVGSLTRGEHKIRVFASQSLGPDLDSLSIQSKEASPPAAVQVLGPNSFLLVNEFVWSPAKSYRVGLSTSGELVLVDKNSVQVWNAGFTGGKKLWMQPDGNLIARNGADAAIWDSDTSHHSGAYLELNDAGRLSVIDGDARVWIDGIPRGTYTGPSSPDLQFPIRGIFYYAWFPETWTVNGKLAKFMPSLGYYNSGTLDVVESHVKSLDYAHVDLSIVSWWGPDQTSERSRITQLMDETMAQGSPLKWSVYQEDERLENDSPDLIRKDLDYLKKWFAWHPAYAHIDGRPVIFVYNEDGCTIADRWVSANSDRQWYVVLKVFPGFDTCRSQPDSWHQYGPGTATIQVKDYSYTISPGFWLADADRPLLDRVSRTGWSNNVRAMVDSGEPWQLITTFNEAGEGTMIESSPSWQSSSGYGWYLDSLHDIF
jgi:hypothetical protein